jgi:hypothetical protein
VHYSPNAVIRDRYQEGVDYLSHDFDLELDEALHLLKQLKNHRSSISVTAPESCLHFYIDIDESLRVEIDHWNGLWADSQVEFEEAIEILRMASACQEFGTRVPTSNREWDAYSGLDDDIPV